ncbi:hypothetical protein MASR2M15_21900 [Anaerolineales bacterium]
MLENHEQTPTTALDDKSFVYLLLGIGSVVFGTVLLFFSVAVSEDIDTLQRAPELIWAFICGAPNTDIPILPLLLTVGSLGIIIGSSLLGWNYWQSRRNHNPG